MLTIQTLAMLKLEGHYILDITSEVISEVAAAIEGAELLAVGLTGWTGS